MLFGDNGIIKQANKAKEESKQAKAEEQIIVVLNEWQIKKRAIDSETTSITTFDTFLDNKKEEGTINRWDQSGAYYKITKDGYSLVVNENGEIVILETIGTTTQVKNYIDINYDGIADGIIYADMAVGGKRNLGKQNLCEGWCLCDS